MATTLKIYQQQLKLPPNEQVSLGEDRTVCEGDSILLDSQILDASYLWSNGETTSAIYVDELGFYTVKVSTSDICSTEDGILVSFQDCSNDQCSDDFLFISNIFSRQMEMVQMMSYLCKGRGSRWKTLPSTIDGEKKFSKLRILMVPGMENSKIKNWIVAYLYSTGEKFKKVGNITLAR